MMPAVLRKYLCLSVALGLALTVTSEAAEDVRARIIATGNAKLGQGDFSGAITDFTLAIQAYPLDGEAYLGRAYALHSNRDLPAAIKDYTRAIALARGVLGGDEWHPGLANMYMNRGKARQDGEEWTDALADYTHALKCDSALVPAYLSRGYTRQVSGDRPGAIADYEEVIKREPGHGLAFHLRGTVRQAQGDFAGAILDFRRVIALVPEQAGYSHFFIWLARVRSGEQAGADEELAAFFKARVGKPEGNWEAQVADFLLGRTKEEAFLQAAASPADPQVAGGQVCEAWYYCGMKRLLAGERQVAVGYFRKCVETGMKDFTEYYMARAQLETLP